MYVLFELIHSDVSKASLLSPLKVLYEFRIRKKNIIIQLTKSILCRFFQLSNQNSLQDVIGEECLIFRRNILQEMSMTKIAI